jgi:DNA polymerase III alpha subunit (gram-positive type)
MCNIAVIDIETSGFSHYTNALCQIGGIIVKPNFELVATFDNYIKPYGKIYSEKAFTINNLPEAFLEEHGEPLGVVINDFINFIFENNVSILVGHNFNFDKRFLVETIKQSYLVKAMLFNNIKVIDTAKMPWPKFLKDKKLETICKYYGIVYSGKHNAMHDCESTLALYKMVEYNKRMFV